MSCSMIRILKTGIPETNEMTLAGSGCTMFWQISFIRMLYHKSNPVVQEIHGGRVGNFSTGKHQRADTISLWGAL